MPLKIRDCGLKLEGAPDKDSNLPSQAFAIALSDHVIEDMIQCVQNGDSIQLALGASPVSHGYSHRFDCFFGCGSNRFLRGSGIDCADHLVIIRFWVYSLLICIYSFRLSYMVPNDIQSLGQTLIRTNSTSPDPSNTVRRPKRSHIAHRFSRSLLALAKLLRSGRASPSKRQPRTIRAADHRSLNLTLKRFKMALLLMRLPKRSWCCLLTS